MRDLFSNPKFYVTVIVVLVIVIAMLVWRPFNNKPTYYAVYLTSGDMYFGQLSFFPSLKMHNAYLLRVDTQNKQNPYSLSGFSDAFWKPEGTLYFNRSMVLWIAPVSGNSPVVQAIMNPQSVSQQPSIVPAATSTGTAPAN